MKTKKSCIIFAANAFILFSAISCGNNKQIGKKALEENKCEQMALDQSSGKLRAYGVSTSQNKSFARDNAILSARRELSATIEAAISSLFTRYRQEYSISNENDFSEKSSQAVKEVVDQIIQYAPVICSNSYELNNGIIETHVCIELQNDWQQSVTDAIRQANKDKLNLDNEKMKGELEVEIEKLRERRGR